MVEAARPAAWRCEPSPAGSKGARTRARLLRIAIERFGEHGYRATSVSEIARAAGVSQATTYAYFADKEHLFVSAVETDASAAVADALDRAGDGSARSLLAGLLDALAGIADLHPLVRRVVAGNEPGTYGRFRHLPARAELAAAIEARVRRDQRSGWVREDIDPAAFADGAEALVVGVLVAVAQAGTDLGARTRHGIEVVFDAALRPPA